MIAGSLEIQIYADIARIKADFDKATGIVTAGAQAMQKAVDNVKFAIGGMVAGLSGAALVSFITKTAEAAETLHDLSIQTGATVEALSALSEAGRTTNTSVQSIAEMMSKLARNMAGAREEGKGTGLALKAIGIDFEAFRRLAPEQQFLTLAKQMDNFADGAGKAAAIQAILGRGAAAHLPYFRDLAQVQELQAKRTTEQAIAGDALSDNLVKLRVNGQEWRNELGNAMLPALSDVSQAVLDVTTKTGGLRDEVKRLSKDGSIDQWTRDAVSGLSYVIDALDLVRRVFSGVGEFLGASLAATQNIIVTTAKVIALVKQNELKAAFDEMSKGIDRQTTIWEAYQERTKDIWSDSTFGKRLRNRMAELEQIKRVAEETKPQVDFQNIEGDGGGRGGLSKAEQQHNAYVDLVARIREKIEANKLEATQERELTEAQRMRLEIQRLVGKETISAKDASGAVTKQLLDELDAWDKASKQAKDFAKSLQENTAAWTKIIETSEQSAQKLEQDIQAQRDHTAAIGLGTTALAELEAGRMRDKAAALEWRAEVYKTIDLSGTTSEALLKEAQRWRELAEARTQGVAQQAEFDRLKNIWQEIDRTAQDAFTHIFEGGRSAFQRLRDTLKATLLQALYQLTVRPWIIQIGTALMPGAAGAAQAAMGGGGGGGSLLGNLFGGGSGGGGLGSMFGGGFGQAMGATFQNGLFGGFGANMGNIGTLISGGQYGAALGAAMPYLGPIAALATGNYGSAAGMAIGSIFGPAGMAVGGLLGGMLNGKRGGPKADGRVGSGLQSSIGIYDSQLNGNLQPVIDQLQAQYDAVIKALGGTGGARFGLAVSTDPRGTSPSFLEAAATRNGQQLFDKVDLRVGRSEAELQDAINRASKEALLKALQASNLPGDLGAFINSIADTSQLDAAMARIQKAAQEKAQLEETLFRLTHTAAEVMTRDRQRELEALDLTNRAQAVRIHSLQDEIAKQQQAREVYAQASAEIKQLKLNLGAYVDRLNATPAGLLAPQEQLANSKAQFAIQLAMAKSGDRNAMQGITGYADQLIAAQIGYTASGTATQDTIAYVKQALRDLPDMISAEQVVADAVQGGTNLLNASMQDLIARADANSAAQIAAINQQAQTTSVRAELQATADNSAYIQSLIAQVNSGGSLFNPSRMAAFAKLHELGVPGYAHGGDYSGGFVHMVGEHGPELRADGPARYWSADQTARMVGGDSREVVQAIARLEQRLDRLAVITATGHGRTVEGLGVVAGNTADSAQAAQRLASSQRERPVIA
jgi:hypothetical protein